MDTLDNPGWRVEIDLVGTTVELKQFKEQWSDRESETRWMHCAKRDGRFHAACGPEMLEDALAVFLSWAEQ